MRNMFRFSEVLDNLDFLDDLDILEDLYTMRDIESLENLDDSSEDSSELEEAENKNAGTDGSESTNLDKAKNTYQAALDESEDDELILSVVESVDGSFLSNPNDKCFDENVLKDQLPLKDSKNLANEIFCSPTNENNAKPNNPTSKRKLLVTDPSIVKSRKIEYERKFPGPAGLIMKNLKKKVSCGNEKFESSNNQSQTSEAICSPFENDAWQKLRSDLEAQSPELLKIVDENIINNVKRMNIIKHTSRKIPLFAAVISHLDPSVSDPSVVLKDPSGDIHGTLHKDFWEQHSHLLIVGSALLLKRVSVLNILNSRKLYLNITLNNVVSIYTPRTDPVFVTSLASISISDYLRESEPAKIVSKENVFTSNHFSSKNTSASTHSGNDSLKILKNSISSLTCTSNLSNGKEMQKSNKENGSDDPLSTTKSLDCNVPAKSQFRCFPLDASAEDSRTKVEKYDLISSIVYSELEGIDTDRLFDDF